MTIKALAEAADVDRGALSKIESGHGYRADTMHRLEKALDQAEEEAGLNAPARPAGEMMEIEVSGDFGVRMVVRGPVSDPEALERSAIRLVREIRASTPGKVESVQPSDDS